MLQMMKDPSALNRMMGAMGGEGAGDTGGEAAGTSFIHIFHIYCLAQLVAPKDTGLRKAVLPQSHLTGPPWCDIPRVW
jgi:hypothetical protein